MSTSPNDPDQVQFRHSTSIREYGPVGFAVLVVVSAFRDTELPALPGVNGLPSWVSPGAVEPLLVVAVLAMGGLVVWALAHGCGSCVQVFTDGRMEVRLRFGLGGRTWTGRTEHILALGIIRCDHSSEEEATADEVFIEVPEHGALWLGDWKPGLVESFAAAIGSPVPQAVAGERQKQNWWSTRRLARTTMPDEKAP